MASCCRHAIRHTLAFCSKYPALDDLRLHLNRLAPAPINELLQTLALLDKLGCKTLQAFAGMPQRLGNL